MKRKALALILVVTILVLAIIALLFAEKLNPPPFSNSDQNSLFIASFSPELYSNKIIGGHIVLVNPTNRSFDNLNLTVEVDDLKLIVPDCLLAVRGDLGWRRRPVTRITIDPYQNETYSLFFGILDGDTFSSYFGDVQIGPFSSHVIRFYVSQNKFGDIINGQAFTIPQKKAYLQIIGYSSIEHSNDTWHEYYNSITNRYEYINDQPNFCQEYYGRPSSVLDPNSYYWAKSFNQLYEHYFNVTVFNNNTYPVESITLFGGYGPDGGGWVVPALPTKILQPNETYVFPVPLTLTGGETNVDNVNQLSTFFPSRVYAYGDLISNQK